MNKYSCVISPVTTKNLIRIETYMCSDLGTKLLKPRFFPCRCRRLTIVTDTPLQLADYNTPTNSYSSSPATQHGVNDIGDRSMTMRLGSGRHWTQSKACAQVLINRLAAIIQLQNIAIHCSRWVAKYSLPPPWHALTDITNKWWVTNWYRSVYDQLDLIYFRRHDRLLTPCNWRSWLLYGRNVVI